ncbi:MAG: hypothetical protein RR346_12070 [Bacteroidales bacterium]
MKLLKCFLSLFIVLVLTSLLSYGMAPVSDGLHWAMFNPMESIESILFMFSFGFGFPIWLSVVVVVLLLLALWYGIYLVLSKIFNKLFLP